MFPHTKPKDQEKGNNASAIKNEVKNKTTTTFKHLSILCYNARSLEQP